MKKINYVKNYIGREGIIAYYLVQYTNCSCCAYSAQVIQLGVLDSNGTPVSIFGTSKFKLLQELVGKKLDHDVISGLVRDGQLPCAGNWVQPHMASPYDHTGIVKR